MKLALIALVSLFTGYSIALEECVEGKTYCADMLPAHERRSAQLLTEKLNVAVLDEIRNENFRTIDTLIFRCSHKHYLDVVVDAVCDERELCHQANINHLPKCEPFKGNIVFEEFKLTTNKEALKKIMLLEREVLRQQSTADKISDSDFERFWAKAR